jgi:hypothetical protein
LTEPLAVERCGSSSARDKCNSRRTDSRSDYEGALGLFLTFSSCPQPSYASQNYDIEAQTRSCIENVKTILEGCGSSMEKVSLSLSLPISLLFVSLCFSLSHTHTLSLLSLSLSRRSSMSNASSSTWIVTSKLSTRSMRSISRRSMQRERPSPSEPSRPRSPSN